MPTSSFQWTGVQAMPHVFPEIRATCLEYTTSQTLTTTLACNLNTVILHVPIVSGDGLDMDFVDAPTFVSFLASCKSAGLMVLGWLTSRNRRYPTQSDFTDGAEQTAQVTWVTNVLSTYPTLDGILLDDVITPPPITYPDITKLTGCTNTVAAIKNFMRSNYPTKVLAASVYEYCTTPSYSGEISPRTYYGDLPQWYKDWYDRDTAGNWFRRYAATDPQGQGYQATWWLNPFGMNVNQDSIGWLQNGYVDFLIPMQYITSTTFGEAESSLCQSFADVVGCSPRRMVQGIGWWDAGDPNYTQNAAVVVTNIKQSRAHNLGGFMLYAVGLSGADDTPLVTALTVPDASNNNVPPCPTANLLTTLKVRA